MPISAQYGPLHTNNAHEDNDMINRYQHIPDIRSDVVIIKSYEQLKIKKSLKRPYLANINIYDQISSLITPNVLNTFHMRGVFRSYELI